MRVAIAGAGNVGRSIASELLENGHEVLLIDREPRAIKSASVPRAEWLLQDACELSALEEAALDRCQVMIAATGDDKVNLVVSLLAKTEFGVPRVVARVNHPKNEWLFTETWGVDVAVSTPRIMSALVEEAVSVGDLVRWPLLGVLVGLATGEGMSWRRSPHLLRAYTLASWFWVVMFGVRLAVQLPLYLSEAVVALGIARVVMGWPLFLLCLWLSWLVIKGARARQEALDADEASGVGDGRSDGLDDRSDGLGHGPTDVRDDARAADKAPDLEEDGPR